MKSAIQTVVVSCAGVVATFLLAPLGTYIALNVTSWGKVITEHQQSSNILWTSVVSGAHQLFLFVLLPTVLIVGLLVGLFARRVPSIAAACAALPISIALGFNWKSAILVLASFAAALLSSRLSLRRRALPAESRA